ncbi:hypothetical protein EDF56_11661 [Novosphingobium sp. PhB165]|uniref:hypothetical protein n=1 Tax=Novosphingobium sp. PhB165 TaxID=2485105 RepID=UPI0010E4DC67|nr:hypothetical protein [Novosphingobium sp. PhB165]TCM13037.1 hypothetical protein EDF56_11661 [Novosphingobium sp. PhB165]
MPSSHRRYVECTSAKIREEAMRIGPLLPLLVEKVIKAKPIPKRANDSAGCEVSGLVLQQELTSDHQYETY